MADSTVQFTRSMGMGSPYPEAPPESAPFLSAFGYPSPMKRLHRALKASLNRVPAVGEDGEPLRERLLQCLLRGQTDDELFAELTEKLGLATAREDLLQKHISRMTAIDFIVDKNLATPDQASVESVRNALLAEDRERFAKVLPSNDGKPVNEWDFALDDPNP